MYYKVILDKINLPEYDDKKINKKIPKNIKYGNPAHFAKKLIYLKNPIIKWKKFLKYIPEPQDYRSNAVKKEILFLKDLEDNLTKKMKKRVYEHDRPSNLSFINLLIENGYSPSQDLYYYMNKEFGHLILKLKI